MTFKDIALPLIAKKFRVIPVQPLEKKTYLGGSHYRRGTLDPQQILAWDRENPNYNAGTLGSPDGVTILDEDTPGLVELIEKETGQKFPPTYTVKSANKGLRHLHFWQTDVSRELGNQGTDVSDRSYDLRGDNQYVVSAGSEIICNDGARRKYEVIDDSPVADFPAWLGDWILKNNDKTRGSGDAGELDPSYVQLRAAYYGQLEPKDMLDLDLTIGSLHPTLKALAFLLREDWRTEGEIAEAIQAVGEKFGWRSPRPGINGGESECEALARAAMKKPPHGAGTNNGLPPVFSYTAHPKIDPLLKRGDPRYDRQLDDQNGSLFACSTLQELQDTCRSAGIELSDDTKVDDYTYAEYQRPISLVKKADWFFLADEFLREKLPPRRSLLDDENGTPLLFEKSLNQIFAKAGLGKTMFTHGLLRCLIKGGKFLRYKSPGGFKVLLADGELPDIQLQERINKIIGPSLGRLFLMSPERMPGNTFPALSDPKWQEEFIKKVDVVKPDVIVFDTLTACFRFDTNDPDLWMSVNQFLIQLRIKGYCVIIAHHAGKSGTQRGLSMGDDNLDVSIKLDAPRGWSPGDGLEFVLTYEKVRASGGLPGFEASYEDGRWEVKESADTAEVLRMLSAGCTSRAIENATGVSDSTVCRIKKKAQKAGEVFPPPAIRRPKKSTKFEPLVTKAGTGLYQRKSEREEVTA